MTDRTTPRMRLDTPNLDILSNSTSSRVAVLDFLEWLQSEHIVLARYDGHHLTPTFTRGDDFVLRWLHVDPVALEAERRAILAANREPSDG